MKRTTKICLIIGVLLLVAGIAVSAVGVVLGGIGDVRNYRPAAGDNNLLQIPAGDISHLEIMADYEDVIILPGENNTIAIDYTDSAARTHEYTLTASAVDGKQVCTFMGTDHGGFWGNINFGFWEETPSITVYLPEQMGLSVHTGSGDVYMKQLTAGNITVTTASGDVEAETVSGKDIGVTTTSGEIDLELVRCSGLSLASVSGDIDAENLTLEDGGMTVLTTTSGEITVHGASIPGNVDLSSVSGEIGITDTDITGDIHAKTTSGDVSIFLNSIDNHQVKTETTSGMLQVPSSSPTAKNTLAVSTTSGDIRVGYSHKRDQHHD